MTKETSTRSWQSATDLIRAGADPADLRCRHHADRPWDGTTLNAVPVCAGCRRVVRIALEVAVDSIVAEARTMTRSIAQPSDPMTTQGRDARHD
jgi:hypothetical protein